MENVKIVYEGDKCHIGIQYEQLPQTAQEIFQKIVMEAIKNRGEYQKILEEMNKYEKEYKEKGYTENEIEKTIVIQANVTTWDRKIWYHVYGIVKTPHTKTITHTIDDVVDVISDKYTKKRNETGQVLIDLAKMTERIEKLRQENNELKKEIEELRNSEDHSDEDEEYE